MSLLIHTKFWKLERIRISHLEWDSLAVSDSCRHPSRVFLAINLRLAECKILRKHFSQFSEERVNILLRKGVYLFDHVKSIEKVQETHLTPKDAFTQFFVNGEHISNEDYQHAQNVRKPFNCKNMTCYHELKLKPDVLLLADVFENFWEGVSRIINLTPLIIIPQQDWLGTFLSKRLVSS